MQHPNKHTCNIRLKKQIKHLEQTFATCVYNHFNMCNIMIYFCNIHLKHLRHTSETYSCDMRFQRNISLLLSRMEAHHRVMFTGGSGSATLLRGGPVVVAACCGREASAARAAGRPRPRDLGEGSRASRLEGPEDKRHDSEASARRAWQG
jgi:hypothetical protein